MRYIEQLGRNLPEIGLGTANLIEDKAVELIEFAIKTGYRLIDTAPVYRSERAIGQAVKNSIGGGTASAKIFLLKQSFQMKIKVIKVH